MAQATKHCTRCKTAKSVEEFSRNRTMRDGRASWCRQCNAESKRLKRERDPVGARAAWRAAYDRDAEKNRERSRRRYREHPEKVKQEQRRSNIKRKYGLTVEEYEAILARGCAICGDHEERLCLDHDHGTGKVRDALCHRCNCAIGYFRDDPALVARALDYLQDHQTEGATK